ncbi:MAG: tetratricopeptide repeat protein [Chthonomonadales bacterium]
MKDATQVAETQKLSPHSPFGNVTLMFTDIEGSTRAWSFYQDTFRIALERHNKLLRGALIQHGGYEVKTIGDSFMVAFSDAVCAANCAIEMQRLIETGPFNEVGGLRIRIGLHSGELQPHRGDYFGPVVNLASRIEGAAHGGQIVMSADTANLLSRGLINGAMLIDTGLNRLKDLGAPVRLFILDHPDLPRRAYEPLRTLNILPHNFPAQLTSFVGREQEKNDIRAILMQKQSRLITITGPGGIGKTRLAMQVAAEVVYEFTDGIWLIELASVTQEREIPAAVALAMHIPVKGENSMRDQVCDHLRDKKALLVFDNFEHVVEGAEFISLLMKQCPEIVCVVTSQHLLQLSGEKEYPLSPLDLPARGASLDESIDNATLQLFLQRAQALKPTFVLDDDNFATVLDICRKLEGIPLAVELTAALVRGMSPHQILPRLDDRFKLLASTRRDLTSRQRSLRGALDWSYDLLSPEEQQLFCQLSVFSGGFSLEDIEAITDSEDPFSHTIALRDKSLIKTEEIQDETRFYLLETLRNYAAEKFAEVNDSTTIRDRHAQHFLVLAQDCSAKLNSSGRAMQMMILNIDNHRAGMDWSIRSKNAEVTIAYGEALGRFFTARGLYEEGDRRLGSAEQCAKGKDDLRALAYILLMRGRIASQSGGLEAARMHYEASLQLSEKIGDRPRMVPPLTNMGSVAYMDNDLDLARKNWEEGLKIAQETGQGPFIASLISNLSIVEDEQGHYDRAVEYLEQGLAMHRAEANRKGTAYALLNYAVTLSKMQEHDRALELLAEARNLFRELGDRFGRARALIYTGSVIAENGHLKEAQKFLDEGMKLSQEMNDVECQILGTAKQIKVYLRLGDLVKSKELASRGVDLLQKSYDQRSLIELLNGYGEILEAEGREADAVELKAVIEHLRGRNSKDDLIKLLLKARTDAG